MMSPVYPIHFAQHITFLPPFQQPCPGDTSPVHSEEVSVSKESVRSLSRAMDASCWLQCSVGTGKGSWDGVELLSLSRGTCEELVASVWRPGKHLGGCGGTYGPSSQFCVGRSLAERTQLMAGSSHLPVDNRAGSLSQDEAIVFPRASDVFKQK